MPLQSMKYPYHDPTADPYATGNPYPYNVYGPQYPGAGYMVPPHTLHTPEPRQPVYAPRPYAPIPMPFFADTCIPALGDENMFDWLESEDPGLQCVSSMFFASFEGVLTVLSIVASNIPGTNRIGAVIPTLKAVLHIKIKLLRAIPCGRRSLLERMYYLLYFYYPGCSIAVYISVLSVSSLCR
jgi:hypothetical protein